MSNLLEVNHIYKPFNYPWAYDAWLIQQQLHWLPEEVPMADDVKDWKIRLTEQEKNLLTHIFRYFTQADIEVNNCYIDNYAAIFKPIEVRMMIMAFSNMETIHTAAYSHLLDTIGMPEIEYQAFLKYKEMKDKYDYMQNFNTNSKHDIALTLAVFGGFTEGMQLFASFAILLNFQRFGKMKGMCQIVTWSVRDETLHTCSVIRLLLEFIKENEELSEGETNESGDPIPSKSLRKKIYDACTKMVSIEDKFVDLAFELGGIDGLNHIEVKNYIRYISNRRLVQMRMKPIFNINENPLPWLDEILNAVEHTNFFENRSTEYSKSSTSGSWKDIFDEIDIKRMKKKVIT